MDAPVTVMETAGEGGAWGMALLADYMLRGQGRSLEAYLQETVFTDVQKTTLAPDPADRAGFEAYVARYAACLPAERAAAKAL